MRNELSKSMYSRHVIASGNGLLYFNLILILASWGVGGFVTLRGAPIVCAIEE